MCAVTCSLQVCFCGTLSTTFLGRNHHPPEPGCDNRRGWAQRIERVQKADDAADQGMM